MYCYLYHQQMRNIHIIQVLLIFQKLNNSQILTTHRINEMWDLCFYRIQRRASNSKMWDTSETRRIKKGKRYQHIWTAIKLINVLRIREDILFFAKRQIQQFCSCASFPRQSCYGECQQHIEQKIVCSKIFVASYSIVTF